MTTTNLADNTVLDLVKQTEVYRQWAAEFNRDFQDRMMKESQVLPLVVDAITEARAEAERHTIKPMKIGRKEYYVLYKPNPLWLRLRTVAKRMRKSA